MYKLNGDGSLTLNANTDLKILTFINLYSLLCFVWHSVLTCIRQESANERYHNTVKDLLLPNTVSQK